MAKIRVDGKEYEVANGDTCNFFQYCQFHAGQHEKPQCKLFVDEKLTYMAFAYDYKCEKCLLAEIKETK